MPEFFGTYQYLSLDLVLLACALACFALLPKQRHLLLLSGLLCLPFAFTSYDFIPEYWDPVLTFHYITSPEDLLFSFSGAVLAAGCALLSFGRPIYVLAMPAVAGRRYFGWGLLGWSSAQLIALLWTSNHAVMYITMIGFLIVMLPLTILRRSWAARLLIGAVYFALLYVGVFFVARWLFPGFTEAWRIEAQLPVGLPAWLPAFELVWGLAYGYAWPLFVLHVLDAEVEPQRVSSSPAASTRPAPGDAAR